MGGTLKPDPRFSCSRADVHASAFSSAVPQVTSIPSDFEGFAMPLSVLTLARTLPTHVMGGLEESSWNLARSLARLGVKETVLTTSFSGRTVVRQEDGIDIHELAYVPERLRKKPIYRWWPYFSKAAASYARNVGLTADVIHTQSLYAYGFLRVRSRPPILATVHGTPRGDYYGGAKTKLINEVGVLHPRILYQYFAVLRATHRVKKHLHGVDAIVPVSRNVAEALPGISRDDPRVVIIPNGIDPDDFPWIERSEARASLGLPTAGTVLLYVGRIEESKGVGLLLRAIRAMPEATLLVAGTGPYLGSFRALSAVDPAGPRVRIMGPVRRERFLLYSAADLFCLPSRNEGQPVSLLEAMAMGTPVATTRPWLPTELLPFAAIGTDTEQVIRAGLKLSESVDRLGLRRLVLDRFNWNRQAQEYLKLFQNLVLRSKRGRPSR